MSKSKYIIGFILLLLVVAPVVFYLTSNVPQANSHLHGDELVENHLHTHAGPFSHDHYHFGVADGTTHSHPHQHPDDHVEVPAEFKDWFTAGHVHEQEDVALFLAKSVLEKDSLVVEFKKLLNGNDERSVPTKPRQVGNIYLNHKLQDQVLFVLEEGKLVCHDSPIDSWNPNLTLVLSGVSIETNEFDVIVPIAVGAQNQTQNKGSHSIFSDRSL